MDGKKLAKRVSNIVDMTVEERSALLRVARVAKALEELVTEHSLVMPYPAYPTLLNAIKEVEHLI